MRKGTPVGRAKVLRAEENRWYLDPQCSDVLSFEAKLLMLLEKISLHRDQYFAIRDKISGIVRVAHYEYNGWPEGWGLASKTLQLLTDLQFELDVDLYVSGPELPDSSS